VSPGTAGCPPNQARPFHLLLSPANPAQSVDTGLAATRARPDPVSVSGAHFCSRDVAGAFEASRHSRPRLVTAGPWRIPRVLASASFAMTQETKRLTPSSLRRASNSKRLATNQSAMAVGVQGRLPLRARLEPMPFTQGFRPPRNAQHRRLPPAQRGLLGDLWFPNAPHRPTGCLADRASTARPKPARMTAARLVRVRIVGRSRCAAA